MQITVRYHGPYQIHRHRKSDGTYSLPSIKQDLARQVPPEIAHAAGVYIFFQRVAQGKLKARYVGVNTTHNLLGEALQKAHILAPEVLGDHGSRWLLLLVCERPDGMHTARFQRALRKMEKHLILDLALKGHPLENIIHQPKSARFDFDLKSNKTPAAHTFKQIVRGKPPYV